MADRLIRFGTGFVTEEFAAANRQPGYIRTARAAQYFENGASVR